MGINEKNDIIQDVKEIQSKDNRLSFIVFLRGTAAIIILLWHLLIMFWSRGGVSDLWPFLTSDKSPYSSVIHTLANTLDRLNLNAGYIGVAIFFLITGFLAMASIQKYQTPGKFLLAKAIRLYPTYIVGFSITFFVIWIYTHFNNITFPYTAKDWVEQVTLIHGFIWRQPCIDQVSWTLIADIEFFVVITVLLLLKKNCMKGFVKTGILLAIIAVLVSILLPKHLESGNFDLYYNSHILMLACFTTSYMLIGAALYEVFIGKGELKYSVISIIILYGCFIICCIAYISDARIYIGSYSIVLVVFIICMMLYKGGYCQKLFANGAISLIARISYSLYIVHGLNGYILETVLYNAGASKILVFPIAALAAFVVAVLLNRFIERPVSKLSGIIFNKPRLE